MRLITEINYFKDGILNIFKVLKNGSKKEKLRQIPNLLTLSRGTIAPIIILPLLFTKKLILAAIMTAIFALTDCLDGFFARKFKAVSEFGRGLDPICDKIFALTLTIPLFTHYKIQIGVIIFLEVLIALINTLSKLNQNEPRTNIIGKVKTVSLSITLILGYLSFKIADLEALFGHFIFATTALQIGSAVDYFTTDMHKNKIKRKIVKKA